MSTKPITVTLDAEEASKIILALNDYCKGGLYPHLRVEYRALMDKIQGKGDPLSWHDYANAARCHLKRASSMAGEEGDALDQQASKAMHRLSKEVHQAMVFYANK